MSNEKKDFENEQWQCTFTNCGYIYDPAVGCGKSKRCKFTETPPGVLFEDLPEEWRCPLCDASKRSFKKLEF